VLLNAGDAHRERPVQDYRGREVFDGYGSRSAFFSSAVLPVVFSPHPACGKACIVSRVAVWACGACISLDRVGRASVQATGTSGYV